MPLLHPRLRGILQPDGRCLTVAMDHGIVHGPARVPQQPTELIERMFAALY